MKTRQPASAIKVSIIFFIVFNLINHFYLNAQQISYYGSDIPVNTQVTGEPVRVLLVFAEMGAGCDPYPQTYWQPGQLPSTASQIIDPYPSSNPTGVLSKYFYDMSFGQYQAIGDYVNQVITVPCGLSGAQADMDNVLAQLTALQQGSNLQFANYSGLADFDKYLLNTGHYIYKNAVPDTKIDILIVCYRNSPHQGCSSGVGCNSTSLIFGRYIDNYGINTGCSFGMCGSLSDAEFIIEELFHDMYGNNNWHLAGESGNWTFPFGVGCYGIATQITANGQSRIVSGWDRQFCNWYGWLDVNRTIQKQELISCIDEGSGNEVSTEFSNLSLYPNSMDFIMRDFVTYGDVIKIKLPHIDYSTLGDTKNQYLWIENHQLLEQFDHSVGQGSGCNNPWIPGIYAQIQVGKDVNGTSVTGVMESTNFAERNFAGSWLYPLTAEGNHDFVFGAEIPGNTFTPCFNIWGAIPIYPFDPNTLPNPFTGYSKLHCFYNTNPDNKLDRFTDSPGPWTAEYDQSGLLTFTEFRRGSNKTGFNSINGTRISISTNPAPVPVFTYHTLNAGDLIQDQNQPNESYENRTIWLNGISIEILQENVDPVLYGPGAMKVRLMFNNYDVDNDVRWCASGDFNQPHQGGIKLSPNDFDPLQPSLVVKQNKTIHVDRGRSDTHCWATGGSTGNYIFTLPTTFTCLPNSFITLEPGAKIIIDNGSSFRLQDQARIILQSAAEIIVRNNSKLILEGGSLLELNDGSKVVIEDGSTLEYFPNAEIRINDINSRLEIAGMLDIKDNADFTFTYSTNLHGYILFNSPLNLPLNIQAGINCSITLDGSNQVRKVLEVEQEGFYPPSNLISFYVQDGSIVLHPQRRVLPLGWQTTIGLDNVRVTSNTFGVNNGHLGFQMVGQYHTVTNSIFEYGKYGVHYIATLGRNDFYASNCVFRYCEEGLFTDDFGAHLDNCHFFGNTVFGWNTGIMSNPSRMDEGTAGGSLANANYQGIYYYAANTATLTISDPNITYNNTSGVQVERTTLIARCGTISYNTDQGIIVGKSATLQMDNGANVTCVGNGTSIELNLANYFYLYKGQNDLTPLQPQTQTAVSGTLVSPGPYPIIADENKWNNSGTIGPNDYSVFYLGNPQAVTDINPQSIISPCGQANPPPPPAPGGAGDPLTNCNDCDILNTEAFTNTRLNEATLEALEKTLEVSPTNYIEAVNLFSQILLEDYINPTNKEVYLLSLNYLKMLDAIGNAVNLGQLTWQENSTTISPVTQMVIDALNKLIDLTITNNDQAARYVYNLDKASVYRLVDRRDLGLNVLNSISPWVMSENSEELNRLICIYNTEHQALAGTLLPIDLYYALDNCGNLNSASRLIQSNSQAENTFNTLDLFLEVSPNPSSGIVQIHSNIKEGRIVLRNPVGEKIYSKGFSITCQVNTGEISKGVYSLEAIDEVTHQTSVRKLIIQ